MSYEFITLCAMLYALCVLKERRGGKNEKILAIFYVAIGP